MGRKERRYPLEQSPLYRLSSKKRLAELLQVPLSTLMALAKQGDNNYNVFDIPQRNKLRTVEHPKPQLERIHNRIFALLSRIETAPYLHSGVKGRSYITNATIHRGLIPVAKIDIKGFYPSTTREAVFVRFRQTFGCAPDISGLLATLTTYAGHVPTGSPASQAVAFFAHLEMFEELAALADKHNITMTCYVDDLTFSGENLTGKFLWEVKKVIHRKGLRYHKERIYKADSPKLVTGVILVGDEMIVPNRLQKDIAELYARWEEEPSEDLIKTLVGKCNAAATIDSRFRSKAVLLRREQKKWS